MNCPVCHYKGELGSIRINSSDCSVSAIGRMPDPDRHIGSVDIVVCPNCGVLLSTMNGEIKNLTKEDSMKDPEKSKKAGKEQVKKGSKKKPNVRTLDFSDLLNEITDTMALWECDDLAEQAESVLGHQVRFNRRSRMFEIKDVG